MLVTRSPASSADSSSLAAEGLVYGSVAFVMVQFGFTVGVTSMTDSGTWNSIFVVGEPSQPCGTENVAVVYEFAAVDVAVAVTWALATPAVPRTIAAVAPRVAVPTTARRLGMVFLPSGVLQVVEESRTR
ncbi:hypothetical protein P9139_10415 [Curtobacterium flaccumfaciens]|nr:hypothetical protein P9139_10415 [Curtobacterium flaccumfaciens]